MRYGDRRHGRRGLRDGFAAVAVAGAVAAGVISGTPAGQHATLHDPETRPAAPLRSRGPTLPARTPSPALKALHTPSFFFFSVSVAVVRAGAAGHHTFSVPTRDGLTQRLADHVGVRQPRGNAYA